MDQQLDSVREFHLQIREIVANEPQLLKHAKQPTRSLAGSLRELLSSYRGERGGPGGLIARTLLSLEETAEWLEAHADDDLDAAADAWADRCYVIMGDAVASGLPVTGAFEAVHRSNMTKSRRDPITGKGRKAENYLAPSIHVVSHTPNNTTSIELASTQQQAISTQAHVVGHNIV